MIDVFRIAGDEIYGSILRGKKGRRARGDMVNYMVASYIFESWNITAAWLTHTGNGSTW